MADAGWLAGDNTVASQLKLLEAAQRAGTIKRFIPSEFGGDYIITGPEGETYNPALKEFLNAKEVLSSIPCLKAWLHAWLSCMQHGCVPVPVSVMTLCKLLRF